MLTISKFFLKYQKHPVIEAVFKGLRPGIVGLLASAVLVLMTTENFGSPQTDLYTFLVSSTLFVGVFIASKVYKVNHILLIVICGVMGFILY